MKNKWLLTSSSLLDASIINAARSKPSITSKYWPNRDQHTLSKERGFSSLVLSNLMGGVLPALLALAECVASLGDVDLFRIQDTITITKG